MTAAWNTTQNLC